MEARLAVDGERKGCYLNGSLGALESGCQQLEVARREDAGAFLLDLGRHGRDGGWISDWVMSCGRYGSWYGFDEAEGYT